MKVRQLQALGALLLMITVGCVTVVDDGDATLTIENQSRHTIFEINLSPTTSTRWGRDLLGPDVLFPGEAITLFDIRCDLYDVRVIDSNDRACELYDVDLCLDDSVWVISNRTLRNCPFL